MALEFSSGSGEETARLAGKIIRLLKPGDAVFLKGQLGTGKTFFVRAAARELGVTEPVTSPSFTMAQTYHGAVTVHHLDLYRLADFSAEDMADFEAFFEEDAITFVEWPEQAEPFLDNPALVITLEHVDENSRNLLFDCGRKELKEGLEALIADAGD